MTGRGIPTTQRISPRPMQASPFLTTSIFTTWGDGAGSQALLPSTPPASQDTIRRRMFSGLRAFWELMGAQPRRLGRVVLVEPVAARAMGAVGFGERGQRAILALLRFLARGAFRRPEQKRKQRQQDDKREVAQQDLGAIGHGLGTDRGR